MTEMVAGQSSRRLTSEPSQNRPPGHPAPLYYEWHGARLHRVHRGSRSGMSDDDVGSFTAEEILGSQAQAVIATDVDGVVVYWNRAAEELYGWSAEEAVGRKVEELTVPEVSRGVAGEIMNALRGGTRWSGGFPLRRKDGTVFPALVTDAGIYRNGTLVGIVGVTTNLGSALRPLLERSTDAALVLRSDPVVTY